MNSEIVNHEMCVDLLGVASSPSSSNYALKRTAVCNINSYGIDASEAVIKNFYVHDFLKPVESEGYAVDLIKRVKKMFTASSFNLKKFICNRNNVLMSTPVIHRTKGVKDTDLVERELLTKRDLGVNWDVEKDALCFKMNLKEIGEVCFLC